MAVSTVTETSAGPDTRFRAGARWLRRYRRERAAAFATVPHYRALWSATSIGEPTPIGAAQDCVAELFPLRTDPPATVPASQHGRRQALRVSGVREPLEVFDLCGPLPSDARSGAVLYHRLLGYPVAFGDCGNWHVVHQSFYLRALPDTDMLAFTALRAEGPRLIDITLGGTAPARLGMCSRHGSPTVTA